MKQKFTLDSPMPPIWMMYPHITPYSIGWRMGYGEGYRFALYDWIDTLKEDEQKQYERMFPRPIFWRSYADEDFDMEKFTYKSIFFWNEGGDAKYTKDKLIETFDEHQAEFVFFWKSDPAVINESCFAQWQSSTFNVDWNTYTGAEQYMMAEKARLFEDKEIEEQIMKSTDSGEMQALGRKVKNFDRTIWSKAKYSIVLNGSYYKFSQNKEMRDFLLSTGDKVLVEASPLDKIWGIGLEEEDKNSLNPTTWKGINLLGFALMEVRDELGRLYKNSDKVDWKAFEKYFIPL